MFKILKSHQNDSLLHLYFSHAEYSFCIRLNRINLLIKHVVAINYNLSKPDKIYILPPALKEVSGITGTDASSIACIQDENGIIFIYDLETKNSY